MRRTRIAGLFLLVLSSLVLLSPRPSLALGQSQDAPKDQPISRRGRKYKAPPETSHIVVLVTKKSNGKPITNAAVVFNPTKDGKDIGSLEIKTDPEGKATIDVIPTGSVVRVQIIANGYATFAEDFTISEANREIAVAMLRPQEQISAYEDNQGKSSARKAGVQEPAKPSKPAAASPASNPAPTQQATPAPAPQR